MAIRQQTTSICREGWLYMGLAAVIFCGALLRDINLLMVLFTMMVGPFLYSWASVGVTLRRLDVGRRLPERIAAGDLLDVDIQVHNRRRWWGSWALLVEDQLVRDDARTAPDTRTPPKLARTFLLRVGPGDTGQVGYRGRLLRRGKYQVGPLTVSTRFPLGLLRRSIRFERVDTLLVCPRIGRVTARLASARDDTECVSLNQNVRRSLSEGDFHALRDWRVGDSRRWIHWRTTARKGELMVRQFERQHEPDLSLVVELWQPPAATDEQLEAVERAVSAAATLVADACRRGGRQIRLATTSDPARRMRGPASMAFFRDAMERLALAEGHASDRLPEIIEPLLAELPPSARILLISTRPGAVANRAVLADGRVDPRWTSWLDRIRHFDASDPRLAEWFGLTDPGQYTSTSAGFDDEVQTNSARPDPFAESAGTASTTAVATTSAAASSTATASTGAADADVAATTASAAAADVADPAASTAAADAPPARSGSRPSSAGGD